MLTHRDGVDHNGDTRDTPAHDERADAQVFLERCPKGHEPDNVEHGPDVARPEWEQS